MSDELVMLLLFQVKHLGADFLLQNRFSWLWMHKHDVHHPGGWVHAWSHGMATAPIMVAFAVPNFMWICVGEMLVHYAIDWGKMNVTRRNRWRAESSPYFWDALGVDQFLHQLTYVVIAWLCLADPPL